MSKILVEDSTIDDVRAFLSNGDVGEAADLLTAILETAPLLKDFLVTIGNTTR